MAEEERDLDQVFQEIAGRANAKVRAGMDQLMDANHLSIQHSRKTIQKLKVLHARYTDILDSLIMAHAIACKEMADLYGDQILGENGIVMKDLIEDDDDDLGDDDDE